jgi:AGCS family alanine or glycine:cation symporter
MFPEFLRRAIFWASYAMAPAGDSSTSGPLSPFQSFMTVLGATIGTGNIAGVATAVMTGGPDAVFWI